jgi:hypothetical protein
MTKYKVTIKDTFENMLFDGVPVGPQHSEASYTVEAANAFEAETIAVERDMKAFKLIPMYLPHTRETTVQTVENYLNTPGRAQVLHLGGRNLI